MRYIHWDRKIGRVYLASTPDTLARIVPVVDGDHVEFAFEIGQSGTDPIVMIAVDLTGTRVGHVLGELVWWIRRKRGR